MAEPAVAPAVPPGVAHRRGNTLVGTGSGLTELFRGLACGLVYGCVSPLIGHPLDTVKTVMQAGGNSSAGAVATARTMYAAGGARAFYRGILPPLVGSSIFRSVQFSAYGAAYGAQAGTAGESVIPGTGGLQARVLTAGLIASFCRSLIETPLEFIKVRQQMAKAVTGGGGVSGAMSHPLVEVRRLFTGFSVSFVRTWGLMGLFFVFVDHLERHHSELLATPGLGPFVKGGVCATAAWIVVWPFELVKNQVQAGMAGLPATSSLPARLSWVVNHRGGVRGLYRGIGPGVTRSLIANGASMVAFSKCKELLFDA